MTNSPQHQMQLLQDRVGLKAASYLTLGAEQLPYDITERLRAARVQALSVRKVVAKVQVASSVNRNGGGTLTWGFGDGSDLWSRMASVVPLIALVLGLLAINAYNSEHRAKELAEVDSALLTDELPPAAFADAGFSQYLASNR